MEFSILKWLYYIGQDNLFNQLYSRYFITVIQRPIMVLITLFSLIRLEISHPSEDSDISPLKCFGIREISWNNGAIPREHIEFIKTLKFFSEKLLCIYTLKCICYCTLC